MGRKATKVGWAVAAFAAVWLAALLKKIPVPTALAAEVDQIVVLIPYWLLVSFGAYSLMSIGYSLFTFRDCPEAYDSLQKEIQQARKELAAKGISISAPASVSSSSSS